MKERQDLTNVIAGVEQSIVIVDWYDLLPKRGEETMCGVIERSRLLSVVSFTWWRRRRSRDGGRDD